MSYFLDDDEDDGYDAFGGGGGGLSQQSVSGLGGIAQRRRQQEQEDEQLQLQQDQFLSHECRQSDSNDPQLTQDSLLSQLSTSNRRHSQPPFNDLPGVSSLRAARADDNDDYFLCENCGNEKSYVDETTGALTCTVCFTQSQTFISQSQQELDYEEAMGMAARSRDGRLIKSRSSTGSIKSHLSGVDSEGRTQRGGRPRKRDVEYDNSQTLPSLDECLRAFVTVLKDSTKLVCLDLMPLPMEMSDKPSLPDEDEDEIDFNDIESPFSSSTSASEKNAKQLQQYQLKHRRLMYNRTQTVIKALWKSYLESWQEGAEYYGSKYPLERFSMRDAFLDSLTKVKLFKVLAGRAAANLQSKIEKEQDEDPGEDSDSSTSESDFDSGGDYSGRGGQKTLTTGVKRKRGANCHQREGDDRTTKSSSCLASEIDRNQILMGESDGKRTKYDIEIPVKPNIRSDDSETSITRTSSPKDGRSKTLLASGDLDDETFIGNELDLDQIEEASIRSDLSDAENHPASKSFEMGRNRIMKLVRLHCRQRTKDGQTRSQYVVKRRDAALLLRPSMKMILGMILIATAPYGVTSSQLIGWVTSGALPLLDAYKSVLLKRKRNSINTKLQTIAKFFSLRSQPTDDQLRRVVRCLHAACGYRPPVVKLVSNKKKKTSEGGGDDDDEESMGDARQAIALAEKSLFEAGRLIRPSNVPVVLAQSVLSLGLSQTVLNYSLALIGLPVAYQSLSLIGSGNKGSGSLPSKDRIWLPPSLPSTRADRLSKMSDLLAVIVVACKLIPGWEKQLSFKWEISDSALRYERRSDKGASHDQSTGKSNRVDDSFVPWNPRIFSQIGNGTREEGYLRFLENGSVLSVDTTTLPRTAKLFSDTKKPDKLYYPSVHNKQQPTVKPRAVLDVLSQFDFKTSRDTQPQSRSQYRRIACDGISGKGPLPLPEGPLIEYIAAKLGARIDEIVKFLIQVEDDLAVRNRK